MGSLAYDFIMNFNGRFADHIMPDKIHVLSVSFLAKKLTREFGGTAGNIAYNLSLLGEKPLLLAAAGRDFKDYKKWLIVNKINIENVRIMKDEYTASAHIITDQDDNQIAAFHGGAMKCHDQSIEQLLSSDKFDLAIVAPDCKKGMIRHALELKRQKVPYVFDPGQNLPEFSGVELKNLIFGSRAAIMNDYEMTLCSRRMKMTVDKIKKLTEYLIITLGRHGSIIYHQNKKYKIPIAKPKNELDPTGAGDAFRAGIIKGLLYGLSSKEMGRIGSLCAAYTVEKYGTQTHRFTKKEFHARYFDNFKEKLSI